MVLQELNSKTFLLKQNINKKKRIEEDISIFRSQLDQALKEQFDIETLIKYQEEDITRLTTQNNKITERLQLIDQQHSQYEQGLNTLTQTLDSDQKTIATLREHIKRKELDEKKQNELIEQKEQEINLIRGIMNSVTTQQTMNSQNEQSLLHQIKKAKEETNKLNSLIQSTTMKKIEENVINVNNSDNHPVLNDIEEENLKELTGLIKKVLEE